MAEHRERFPGVVMIGVGAAFDFHAGRIRQAPGWMQKRGLEWLYRLCREPGRLWKRYILTTPWFLPYWAVQKVSLVMHEIACGKQYYEPEKRGSMSRVPVGQGSLR
jgi:N-acetylglucosaminyldiphosphoundecaprenol N-acetyl-beta-D-mannosaminyltransferase